MVGQSHRHQFDELDVIRVVLGCGVDGLLLPEPEKVPGPSSASTQEQAPAVGQAFRRNPHRSPSRAEI